MSRQGLLGFIGLAIFFLAGSAAFAANPYLHYFDCKNCHFPNATMAQMSENHICLKCHSGAVATSPADKLIAAPASARIDGASAGVFSTGDASARFGHNPLPVQQTSHNWFASNTQPAAGAKEPNRTLYTGFYSRFGASLGKVTCSRCHNPHGEAILDANGDNIPDNLLANPKLLIADAGNGNKPMNPEKMCRACHEVWANTSDHGWLTHPLVADYATAVGAKPGYKPAQSIVDAAAQAAAEGRSAVNLISYQGATGIGCLSCHAVHYADSDAGTADGVGESLSSGDGKLLRGDGAGRADTSGLCQSCHSYQVHGAGEPVGCLVCHGGHSYDPTLPNYFVLRKSATTTAYGTVSGLDYSSPGVLEAGLKYTFWNDRTDGTANGYCEKCHGDARNIPDGGGGYHTTTAVCTDCHRHGGTAGTFAPGCNLCHGMPPTAGTPGAPDGLVVTPAPTNSTTAGAHAAHVTSKQYACDSCHYNSAGRGTTHNDGAPQSITIGFSLFNNAYRGGTYNGQGGVNYDSSQADTTVTNSGAKTCANVYCHGGTMASNGGTNRTPAWDNPTTGSCGKCHGATATNSPQLGSHRTHVMNDTWYYDTRSNPPNPYIYGQKLVCTTCHNTNAATHVNGQADWSFNLSGDPRLTGATYKGSSSGVSGTVPGSYGQCANLYCHSIAQTSTGGPLTGLPGEYQTPTWGALSEGTCGSCHNADQGHAWFANRGSYGNWAPYITSGSHARHLQSLAGPDPVGMSECAVCHNYVGSDSLSGCASLCHNRNDLHVNHEIDVKFPPTLYGATAAYSGTKTPGDGYGACAATYCHGNYPGSGKNATPTWGDISTAACGSCHGGSNSDQPDSGSHAIHANAGAYNIACTACHSETVSGSGPYTIASQVKHVNRKIDWAFDDSDARLRTGAEIYNIATGTAPPSDGTTPRVYSTCGNIYCHSNAQPDGGLGAPDSYGSPVWGNIASGGCGFCHKTGTHGDTGAAIDSGSHAAHLAGNTSGVIKCMTCHRYNTTLSGPVNGCANCHLPHSPQGSVGLYTTYVFDNHVDGRVTINIDPIYGASSSYSGTPAPGDGYGTCSNISCHGAGTPQWGGTVTCDSCHGNPPATGAHLVHTDGTGAVYGSDGNASTDANYRFNCGNCHPLAGSMHHNGAVDVELYNAAATGFKKNNPVNAERIGTGTSTVCLNIYCHSSGQDASIRTYATTPAWGETFSGNGCAGCHNDPPSYVNGGTGSITANSHYASQMSWDRPVEGGHLVGLHFDNIRKNPPDTSAPLFLRGGSAASGAGHGDPATSTTISCPTCHAGTVSVAGQFSAPGTIFSCQSCHATPVAGSIANRANHVNGKRDVQFMTGTFRTRAQLQPDPPPWPEPLPGPFTAVIAPLGWTRNNGFKTANDSHDSIPFSGSYNAADKSCTTICHLNQPATWGDTSKGCFACHADL